MLLHHGPLDAGDQALEPATAHALVRRASRGEIGEALRIHGTTAPVAVFGRRDTRLPGFGAASAAASAAGFVPLVRAAGGRAVAYTGKALVVDHVRADGEAMAGHDRRFEEYGALLAGVLRGLGIDAQVGAVPGEYCPGAHSVNARGTVKLIGTAQRIVKDAWLFSSLVVVGDEERLRPVLADVYGHLGQPFDPASVGSVSGEAPAVTSEDVEQAILAAHGLAGAVPTPLDPETLALAHELVDQHRC